MEVENINPNVYKKLDDRNTIDADFDDDVTDPFDTREIFGNNFISFPKKNILLAFKLSTQI